MLNSLELGVIITAIVLLVVYVQGHRLPPEPLHLAAPTQALAQPYHIYHPAWVQTPMLDSAQRKITAQLLRECGRDPFCQGLKVRMDTEFYTLDPESGKLKTVTVPEGSLPVGERLYIK